MLIQNKVHSCKTVKTPTVSMNVVLEKNAKSAMESKEY